MKSKWSRRIPIILIILDLILIVAIAGVFYLEKKREEKTSRILKNAVAEVTEEMKNKGSGNGGDGTSSGAEEVVNASAIPSYVLSIRGDLYAYPDGKRYNYYPQLLGRKLKAEGIDATVLDYTLDRKSMLTHLYYAGVSEDVIDSYISKNKGKGGGIAADPGEIGTGDVSKLKTDRDDKDAIPVIYLGNYGGWGKDVYELIDMINDILATYNNPSRYMIISGHPSGYEDSETFDRVMKEYWGGHYLDASGIAGSSLVSKGGHYQIANLIFKKLESWKLA